MMTKIKILWTVFILLSKGGESDMAVLYSHLVIMEARTFASVPNAFKEQVRQILLISDAEHLIIEE